MIQQQLKFGVTCGIVGILLLGCSLPVRSTPPSTAPTPNTRFRKAEATPTAPVQPTARGQKLPVSAQVIINGQKILLEVARTSEEQSTGLMYRTQLAANRGMLFVFSPPRPVSFWMKNTLIPLDMVFLSNGVVKHVSAKVPPCKTVSCPGYGPDSQIPIDNVIELPSGRAAELRLRVGDRLKIETYSAKILKY